MGRISHLNRCAHDDSRRLRNEGDIRVSIPKSFCWGDVFLYMCYYSIIYKVVQSKWLLGSYFSGIKRQESCFYPWAPSSFSSSLLGLRNPLQLSMLPTTPLALTFIVLHDTQHLFDTGTIDRMNAQLNAFSLIHVECTSRDFARVMYFPKRKLSEPLSPLDSLRCQIETRS